MEGVGLLFYRKMVLMVDHRGALKVHLEPDFVIGSLQTKGNKAFT